MSDFMTKRQVGREAGTEATKLQLPVFYNKGGMEVRAHGTRFSSKGCFVLTKRPHDCGTAFSLKITHPCSSKSINVDGSVIMRKHFAAEKNWGMVVRFMNVNERERDEIQRILADAETTPESSGESKYLKTPIGQAILKCFNLKRFIN
jgi:hypothetical protein